MLTKHTTMYLRMITQSFFHRVTRVFIAVLSIAVGSATLAGLGLVAHTVPMQLKQELRSYGANMIVVPSGAEGMRESDVAAADSAAGSSVLARAALSFVNVLYNQQSLSVLVSDIDDVTSVRQYWVVDGALPGDGEILVGENVAQTYRFAIGDHVGLAEPTREGEQSTTENVTVSGVLSTGGGEDDLIVMSPATYRQIAGGESPAVNLVEYSMDGDSHAIDEVAHRVTDAGDGHWQGETVRRISNNESGIASTLQALIWIVSLIIVVLTVISVSATLNAVVTERSREFGLKKALGALSSNILTELLGESVLLGSVGGMVGALCGIWIARFISLKAFAISIGINWWVIPITVVVSVVVTLVGTLLPAKRISRIQPSTVLSGE